MTCKHDGLHLSAQGSAAGLLQPCLLCAKMVLVTESRRRNSLNFANERKVMHLHHQGLSAPKIRLKVKNLEGKRPSKDLVNTTIKNRHLLESDDWLSNPGNRVLLSWPVAPSAV